MKVRDINQLAWAGVWPFLIAYPLLLLYLGTIFSLIWFSQSRYSPAEGDPDFVVLGYMLSAGIAIALLIRWAHRGHITGEPRGPIFKKKQVTARTKLGSSDPDIRREGIEALVRIGPSCLPMLLYRLYNGNEKYREAAMEAIDRIHPRGLFPALIGALEDEELDSYSSLYICWAILDLPGDRTAPIPSLIAVLRKGEGFTKAEKALSAKGFAAFSPLMEVLEDTKAGERARSEAIWCLRNCLPRRPEEETHKAALRRLEETLARIASDDDEDERLRTLAKSELEEPRSNAEKSLESLGEIYRGVFSRHGHTDVGWRYHASDVYAYGRGRLTPIEDSRLCSEIAYQFALSKGRNALCEVIEATPQLLIESKLWALVLIIHKRLFRYGYGAPDDLLVESYLRTGIQPDGVIGLAVPLLDVHSFHLRIEEMYAGRKDIFEYSASPLFPRKTNLWQRLFENPTKKNNAILDFFRPCGFVHWEAFRTFARASLDWVGYDKSRDFWLHIHQIKEYRAEFPFIVLGKDVSEVDNESVGDVVVDVFLHQCDDEAGIVRLMQSDRIAGWPASMEAPPEYRSIYDHPDVAPHYRSVRIRVPRSPGITVLRAGDSLLITYTGPDDFIEIPIEDSN